jgi:hypothetical protein
MFLRREHEGNTKDVPVSQIQGQVSKSSLFGVLFSSPKKIPASKITTLRSMCATARLFPHPPLQCQPQEEDATDGQGAMTMGASTRLWELNSIVSVVGLR